MNRLQFVQESNNLIIYRPDVFARGNINYKINLCHLAAFYSFYLLSSASEWHNENLSLTYNPTTRLGLQNLSPIFKSARMVRDVYVNMVEDIIGILLRILPRYDACIFRISVFINVAAHRKSRSAILLARLNWVTPGHLWFFFVASNIQIKI